MVGGERNGLFWKPPRVGGGFHLFGHEGQGRSTEGHTKATPFSLDMERDIENAAHVTVKGSLFRTVKGARIHVNFNRGVGKKMHEVEHLHVRCSLHLNVHRAIEHRSIG